jgi:hypothetical protein
MWVVGLGGCPALAPLFVCAAPSSLQSQVGSCALFVAGVWVPLLLLLVGPETPGAQAFIPHPSDRWDIGISGGHISPVSLCHICSKVEFVIRRLPNSLSCVELSMARYVQANGVY